MNNIFRLFFVSFLFFHLLLPAQNGQPVFPKAINNAKTTKHKQVPGTRVSLIPPVGFNNAVAFTGMESKDASIHVLDFPGKNYFKTSAGMAKDSFEKRGVTVFEFYEFQFNGFPAKFMHLAGDNHQKTYSLAFGDSTFSVMLLGTYGEANETTGNNIRASLLSALYDKLRKIDPQESARFKVEEQRSLFKFAKNNSGFYIYSIGGKVKDDYQDDPFMIISEAPYDTAKTVQTMAEETLLMMQKHGLMNFSIGKSGALKVNGFAAYEMEITGFVRGAKTFNYVLLVRLRRSQTMLVQGISKNDNPQNLLEMKKLGYSLRPK